LHALKRIVLGLQYDGAPWQGWQTQAHGLTVQDRFETALAKFTGMPLATTCAGRTDTGVHALEQVVHFDTELTRDHASWLRGVNTFLPPSIAVQWAAEVPIDGGDDDFHARFSARARTYQYVLHNYPVRSPLLVGKAGWSFRPLALEPMRAAAACLIGSHDFSAFRSSQCQAKSPVKNMYEVRIEQRGDLIVFTLRASAFLHHMVRNLMGALISIGSGSQPPSYMAALMAERVRALAPPTFPPSGLYFLGPHYDAHLAIPQRTAAHDWLPNVAPESARPDAPHPFVSGPTRKQ
jgi:tRNA pseudouridine38-40 synthase